MSIVVGQPLFAVRQKHRRVQFSAPVSGRVVKINTTLSDDCEALEMTPYQNNWVCVIDADKLKSKSKNSPFDGRRLQGRVVLTMVGGRKVFGE